MKEKPDNTKNKNHSSSFIHKLGDIVLITDKDEIIKEIYINSFPAEDFKKFLNKNIKDFSKKILSENEISLTIGNNEINFCVEKQLFIWKKNHKIFILNKKLNGEAGSNILIENLPVLFWKSEEAEGKEKYFYKGNSVAITGYDIKELENLSGVSNSLIYEGDIENYKKRKNEFEKGFDSNSAEFVYRIITKNNEIKWLKESVSLIKYPDGTIKNKFGFFTDITSIKNNEDELIKNEEKWRESNAIKDRFIAILSHDLRAPFTSILGFAEILLNEQNLPLNEKQEYLNYIYEASQNQLQLVNYLLDWSRLQTGGIKVQPQRLKAEHVVYECVSSLTGNAMRKNIEIKVNVNSSAYVKADKRLLSQVINNLLNNAIKFSNESQFVEVNVNLFNNEQVEFIIRDFGIGISSENQDRIFKLDKMFSTEGTKGEKGTGLGLSLVKEIVEKHNGDIWFYSREGDGSEFHFTIPVADNTILIVEDNKTERTLYNSIIKKHLPGFKVIEAENGFEAMNLILTTVPSVIVTDHEMPLMNGLQLIESLSKGEESLKIPVIAIIANITEELKISYNQLGIKALIKKPATEQQLAESLSSVLT